MLRAALLAVGAVYDRATFASEWAKCAVIDRAYSGKWVANSHVVQSPSARLWIILKLEVALWRQLYG